MTSPKTTRPNLSLVVPLIPASAAGPPFLASRTRIPLTPSVSLACSGASAIPRIGLTTFPNLSRSSTLLATLSTGMAKPMPLEPPEEE